MFFCESWSFLWDSLWRFYLYLALAMSFLRMLKFRKKLHLISGANRNKSLKLAIAVIAWGASFVRRRSSTPAIISSPSVLSRSTSSSLIYLGNVSPSSAVSFFIILSKPARIFGQFNVQLKAVESLILKFFLGSLSIISIIKLYKCVPVLT